MDARRSKVGQATRIFAMASTGLLIGIGSALAEGITSRNSDDAYADMVRDWSAKPSATPNKQVQSRSVEAANADMVRNWDAKMVGEPQKPALSQSERDRYMELMRGTFPLSHVEDK